MLRQTNQANEIAAMTKAVTNSSLQEFAQQIGSNRWNTPVIYSRWHVEKVATNDPSPVKLLALEFGRALAVRQDQWCQEILASDRTEVAANMAGVFLNLAEWLEKSPGYGNLILSSSCRGSAQIGIGRMIVDTNWPLEAATVSLKRSTGFLASPSVRMRVLNDEAGAEIFAPIASNEAENQITLEKTWQTGALTIIKNTSPKAGALFEDVASSKSVPPEWRSFFKTMPSPTSVMSSNIAFFKDLDGAAFPKPMTTLASIEIKWHRRFTDENPVERRLGALADFRGAIGFFPTNWNLSAADQKLREQERNEAKQLGIKITYFEDKAKDNQEAAFYYAWVNYWKAKGQREHSYDSGVAGTAWETFVNIKGQMPQSTNDPSPVTRYKAGSVLVERGKTDGVDLIIQCLPELREHEREGALSALLLAKKQFGFDFTPSRAAFAKQEVLVSEWIAWWKANKLRYSAGK